MELSERNKIKQEVAREILDKIFIIVEESKYQTPYEWVNHYIMAVENDIIEYIQKEHLFISDYTNDMK